MKVSNHSNAKWVWLFALLLFVFVAATAVVVVNHLDNYLLDDSGAISLLGAAIPPNEINPTAPEDTVINTASTEPPATWGTAETEETELQPPTTEEPGVPPTADVSVTEEATEEGVTEPTQPPITEPAETNEPEPLKPETNEPGTGEPGASETDPEPTTPQQLSPQPTSPTSPSPAPTSQQDAETSFRPGFEAGDEKTVWTTNTKVVIFRVSYENEERVVTVHSDNGDKLFAPGTENSYTFKLKNTGNVGLKYTVDVEAYFNPADLYIPIWGRLNRYDGKWIVGGLNRYVEAEQLNGAHDEATLGAGKYTYYTLDWNWPFESGDDEWDTMLGNLAVDQDLTFTIIIKTRAEALTDGDDSGGGGDGGGGGGGGGITPPYTGDDSNLTLWIVIALAAFGIMMLIAYFQNREDRKSDAEADKK